MKSIIIKTDRPYPDAFLVSCLRRLFPECDIHVVPVGAGHNDRPHSDQSRTGKMLNRTTVPDREISF